MFTDTMRKVFHIIVSALAGLAAVVTAEEAVPGVPYAGLAAADTEGGGVIVTAVAHYGPADRGGVNAGDTVLSVNDRPISGKDELQSILTAARPGDKVKLVVQRRHLQLTRTITISNRLEPQAVFRPSDKHLSDEEWDALEHQQRLIAAQLATETPDPTAISAAFAAIRKLRSEDWSGECCHLFFWGSKSLLYIRGNEDSLIATEVFFDKDKADEKYRLSGRGAVPCLPEHLRKRIRYQLETLPDFQFNFSLHLREKQ